LEQPNFNLHQIYRALSVLTCEDIITTLRNMDMREVNDYGYIPNYTRTALTDALHENAGFRTDYELIYSNITCH
jgi:hypothetical protein